MERGIGYLWVARPKYRWRELTSIIFVATKDVFCRDKIMFVATKRRFVTTLPFGSSLHTSQLAFSFFSSCAEQRQRPENTVGYCNNNGNL